MISASLLALLSASADPQALSQWTRLAQQIEVHALAGHVSAPTPLQGFGAPGPRLISFWATYCPPCIREMPVLEALNAGGRRVLGVSLDAGREAAVRKVLKRADVSFPNAVISKMSLKAASRHLGDLPLAILFNRDGRALQIFRGVLKAETVIAAWPKSGRRPD